VIGPPLAPHWISHRIFMYRDDLPSLFLFDSQFFPPLEIPPRRQPRPYGSALHFQFRGFGCLDKEPAYPPMATHVFVLSSFLMSFNRRGSSSAVTPRLCAFRNACRGLPHSRLPFFLFSRRETKRSVTLKHRCVPSDTLSCA